MPANSLCYLTIGRDSKAIPYDPATRENGEVNHGFKLLKGRPESEALAIPEATELPALGRCLVEVNRSTTSFLTIGCGLIFDHVPDNGTLHHRVRVFVEFAINSIKHASDPHAYFALYMHFNDRLHEIGFNERALFDWQLDRNMFTATRRWGYCTTVWIETQWIDDAEAATAAGSATLDVLTDFLRAHPQLPAHEQRIYS